MFLYKIAVVALFVCNTLFATGDQLLRYHDDSKVSGQNIDPSRFYYNFSVDNKGPSYLQVMEVHNYHPTAGGTYFAVRVPSSQLNADFKNAMAKNLGFSEGNELYFLIQAPGNCLRPHHVLFPKGILADGTHRSNMPYNQGYANFNTTANQLWPVSPSNVAINFGNPNVNIHASSSPEPVLSPNNFPITVAGQPLTDYVEKNGAVMFATRISGNGRTIFSLHYVVDNNDSEIITDVFESKPQTVNDFLNAVASNGMAKDPCWEFFAAALRGGNPGHTIAYDRVFPDGFEHRQYVEEVVASGKNMSSGKIIALSHYFATHSILKADESAEQSLAFLKQCQQKIDKRVLFTPATMKDLAKKIKTEHAAANTAEQLKKLEAHVALFKSFYSGVEAKELTEFSTATKQQIDLQTAAALQPLKTVFDEIKRRVDQYDADKLANKSPSVYDYFSREGDQDDGRKDILGEINKCIEYRAALIAASKADEDIRECETVIRNLKSMAARIFPLMQFSDNPNNVLDDAAWNYGRKNINLA